MTKQLKMMVWTASVMLVLCMVFAACKGNKSKAEADDDEEEDIEMAEDRDYTELDDESDEKVKCISVNNARDLILALQDNVEISVTTSEVLRLSDAIDELVEEGKLERYPVNNRSHVRPGVYWEPVYDGKTLFIVDLKNITLDADPDEGGFLLATPRYADVLHFENCENVTISNFTMGHEETGNCEGDVLVVNNCKRVHVEECNLFGCGVNGFSSYSSSIVTLIKTKIYGCSDRGIDLYSSEKVVVGRSEIFNNGSGMYVDPYCTDVSFHHCNFHDIRGQLFLCYAPVDIDDSKIVHHHDDIAENVNFKNCEVVMDYVDAEEYPDIEDDGEY